MRLANLSLTNFRSYRQLDLALGPGLSVVAGENAQGKSNLLEAVYLLAIGKSRRAASERDLVSWQAAEEGGYAMVAASLEGQGGPLELRVALDCREGPGAVKRVRVNGVPKRALDLVGLMSAALFEAEDVALVFGPPAGRRRYLDALLAQASRPYALALARYQKTLAQRNALLRALREGRAREDELAFWDESLAAEGAVVVGERWDCMPALSGYVAAAFERLSGGGALALDYAGTAERSADGPAAALRSALAASRRQERAQAMTVVGPHRDDLRLTLDGAAAARHASRGQARVAALAMRLGEARLLAERKGEPPLLLLDDALSELDERRRALALEEIVGYPQVIVTTADLNAVPREFLDRARVLRVSAGRILPEASA